MSEGRLDKLLWSLRLYKTRPLATDACEAGRVAVGQHEAKPGRKVHAGEIIVVRLELATRTIRVTAIPASRVGAKQLPQFMDDLTPPAEYERAKQAAVEAALARQRGAGRPTKKQRREIGKFFGW
jgi:ribosome-associated heat shock protein Hsp15